MNATDAQFLSIRSMKFWGIKWRNWFKWFFCHCCTFVFFHNFSGIYHWCHTTFSSNCFEIGIIFFSSLLRWLYGHKIINIDEFRSNLFLKFTSLSTMMNIYENWSKKFPRACLLISLFRWYGSNLNKTRQNFHRWMTKLILNYINNFLSQTHG